MTNGINFYYSNVMQNLFLEQSSSDGAGVSFRGIGSIQDFWDVHMDPIMNGLYWEQWYNGENASEPGFIYFENKLLGVPRLRQLRVEKGSCKVHTLFKNTIKDCYDSYSFLSEDKNPFGKYATDQSNMVDTA
jgi:polycystin 2